MERSSVLLIIREMNVKTTVRSHLTPIRRAIIKRTASVGEDVEKRKPSCTVRGNVNRYSHYGKQFGASSKN